MGGGTCDPSLGPEQETPGTRHQEERSLPKPLPPDPPGNSGMVDMELELPKREAHCRVGLGGLGWMGGGHEREMRNAKE